MNLRAIANAGITAVNPNITVQVQRSTGYTIGAGRKQTPTYASPVAMQAQLQSLSGKDLQQLDGLNLQGIVRAISVNGSLAGVNRPNGTGGDLLTMAGRTWLVVQILDAWPGWTRAAIVRQGDA